MPNYSKVIQIGHLTRDPELRYLNNGTPVSEISIATNYKSGDYEEVSFIGCTAFGKTAEMIAQYYKKGDAIGVEGRLTQQRWEDGEGKKRDKTKITVTNVIPYLGKKSEQPQAPSETTDLEPF